MSTKCDIHAKEISLESIQAELRACPWRLEESPRSPLISARGRRGHFFCSISCYAGCDSVTWGDSELKSMVMCLNKSMTVKGVMCECHNVGGNETRVPKLCSSEWLHHFLSINSPALFILMTSWSPAQKRRILEISRDFLFRSLVIWNSILKKIIIIWVWISRQMVKSKLVL